jgi:hypothetical protein
MHVEWLQPDAGTLVPADPVEGRARRSLKAPFPGQAVLYLFSETSFSQ